jgi:hypothetical protein
MTMWKRLGRLFVIKTKFEAYLIIYAIALGAIERGRVYLEAMPGMLGWVFAVLCTGVVFVAGAKLIDSVKPVLATGQEKSSTSPQPWKRPRRVNRNLPSPRRHSDAASASARRRD